MNELIKKLTIFLIAMTLLGCANVKNNDKWIRVNITPINESNTPDKLKYLKNYVLNQRKIVHIGDEIIKIRSVRQNTYAYAYIDVSEKIDVNLSNRVDKPPYIKIFEISKNKYPVKYKLLFDEKNEIADSGKTFYLLPYQHPNALGQVADYSLLVSEDGYMSDKAIYQSWDKLLYLPTKLAVSPNTSKFSGELAASKTEKTGTPHYELLYTGKNDVSLNITYKEYTADDLARPSFFQNLTYEANAKQIRFKGFILKINEATNEKFDFTVIEDGLVDEI